MPSETGPASAAPDPATLPPEIRRIEAMLPFQRRTWRCERLGWLGMLALVVAGLLGGLGGTGWLGGAEAVTPDGALRISYRGIQRLMAPTVFRVEALRPPAPEGWLELRLGAEFLARWRVMELVPPPAESRGDAGGLVLAYRVHGGREAVPALLVQAEPEGVGLARVAIGTAGGEPAVLRILVWP